MRPNRYEELVAVVRDAVARSNGQDPAMIILQNWLYEQGQLTAAPVRATDRSAADKRPTPDPRDSSWVRWARTWLFTPRRKNAK